ncbi:hypothetical protein BGZ90_005328, partial [Linnemannia elongata]
MSTSPSLLPEPQQQHHHHHSGRLEEQQEQQKRHLQRLEQYRQHPILPSQPYPYAQNPHPYHPYHPYHSHHNVHIPQHQHQPSSSSSLLPPLPIEHQTSSPTIDLPSSQQNATFYSPTPSWRQQLSSSLTQSNLQQLLFDENSAPFEGFSVPPEYVWDPLTDSGSSLFATSADPDLFRANLDTSGYYYSTPDLSTTQEENAAVAGSANQSIALSSRKAASGPQRQRSLKLRVDRRIDMYREPEKRHADQPNYNDNNNDLQAIMPSPPNEWYGSSSPPPPPLSPLRVVDTNGFQSSLVQSLANLTTSSPNITCLSPPAFSSAFGQSSFAFSDSQRSVSISSDNFSGLYTQSDEDINNSSNNNDQDNNDHDNGRVAASAAEVENDESDRRFQCPICPKRFLRQYNLNAHLNTHSQVRAHACTQCDKSFLRPYDLSRHQRIHSNSKPYTCNICQLIFIRNDAIWRHYRRAHPGHPDVPPARRQRRPQRISISPGTTTTAAAASITIGKNNN